MKELIVLTLESYRDDGKFVCNESDDEYTIEEAIKIVKDGWDDMLRDYFSWELKEMTLKYEE